MGESGSKTITVRLLVGAAAANHIWWLNANPYSSSLPHPNSYRISYLPFGSPQYLILLIAIVSSTAINQLGWISRVRQMPIKPGGLIPTPIPVHYRTQTD